MSDVVIFLVGSVVFFITTTASLLYGYFIFNGRAESQGMITIGVASDGQPSVGPVEPSIGHTVGAVADELLTTPVEVIRKLPLLADPAHS